VKTVVEVGTQIVAATVVTAVAAYTAITATNEGKVEVIKTQEAENRANVDKYIETVGADKVDPAHVHETLMKEAPSSEALSVVRFPGGGKK
jgi:hypothetical protein